MSITTILCLSCLGLTFSLSFCSLFLAIRRTRSSAIPLCIQKNNPSEMLWVENSDWDIRFTAEYGTPANPPPLNESVPDRLSYILGASETFGEYIKNVDAVWCSLDAFRYLLAGPSQSVSAHAELAADPKPIRVNLDLGEVNVYPCEYVQDKESWWGGRLFCYHLIDLSRFPGHADSCFQSRMSEIDCRNHFARGGSGHFIIQVEDISTPFIKN